MLVRSVFVLLFLAAPFGRAVDLNPSDLAVCADRFARLEKAGSARFADSALNRTLTVSGGGIYIDGLKASRYSPPASHHPGKFHDGLFRLERDGHPRLMKVYDLGGSSDPFDTELQGMLLAQEVGGPKVHAWGRLKTPEGSTQLFVEMEEFFHGQASTTFKGMSSSGYRSLAKGENPITRQIASYYVEAFELKLLPDLDVDFIFSNGQARWIDTGGWVLRPAVDATFVQGPNAFIRTLGEGDRKAAQAFVRDLVGAVHKSTRLTLTEKEAVLSHVEFGEAGLTAEQYAELRIAIK